MQARHDCGLEALARELLLAAASAEDPSPLLAAARALLDEASAVREAEGVVKLDDARRRATGGGAG